MTSCPLINPAAALHIYIYLYIVQYTPIFSISRWSINSHRSVTRSNMSPANTIIILINIGQSILATLEQGILLVCSETTIKTAKCSRQLYIAGSKADCKTNMYSICKIKRFVDPSRTDTPNDRTRWSVIRVQACTMHPYLRTVQTPCVDVSDIAWAAIANDSSVTGSSRGETT